MTAREFDRRVAALAASQHGVFSRRQARELGASSDMVKSRLLSGAWKPMAEDVLTLRGTLLVWRARLRAATLVPAGVSWVSHEAGGALHELSTFNPGPVAVLVPHGRSRRTELAVVHQTRDLALPDHVTTVDGIPVTTIPRTLVDLAAIVGRRRLEHVVNDAVVARQVTLAEIESVVGDVARRGKAGMGRIKAVLDDLGPGPTVPASRLEALLLRVLRKGGVPVPVLQHELPWRTDVEGRVDMAFPLARLIIEVDSRRYHTRVRDFEVDRRRDNAAQLAGWRVLRFTYADLRHRPDEVVAEVLAALALAA
jgi:hypothetical protein